MTDTDKIAAIRHEMPATTHCVYLNTGTSGPLPRCAEDVIQAETNLELLQGRIDRSDGERKQAVVVDLRARFARLLGAFPDEIALTHHTTDGMNIGTWGLNWQPGDELVITSLDHPGGLMPAYTVGRRRGVTVRVVDLGLGNGDVVARLERAITPRSRLLSISHVSFSSGALLPLAEIVEVAHRRHVLVLVDGAQSAGAIPVDVHGLGVDIYAMPGQKWLCGPEGVGALYVRRDLLSELHPTFLGYSALAPGSSMDLAGQYLLHPNARRYEVGTMYWPALAAMEASLRWLEEELGWQWIWTRIAGLARQAVELLAELPGITVLTPANRAGLLSFTVDGMEPEDVVARLAAQRILIRSVNEFDCLRVSTGFYNSTEDLLALRDALAAILAEQ